MDEVAREQAFSFLEPRHQARIAGAYRSFTNDAGFARVVRNEDALQADGDLSISRYVGSANSDEGSARGEPAKTLRSLMKENGAFQEEMDLLVDALGTMLGRPYSG